MYVRLMCILFFILWLILTKKIIATDSDCVYITLYQQLIYTVSKSNGKTKCEYSIYYNMFAYQCKACVVKLLDVVQWGSTHLFEKWYIVYQHVLLYQINISVQFRNNGIIIPCRVDHHACPSCFMWYVADLAVSGPRLKLNPTLPCAFLRITLHSAMDLALSISRKLAFWRVASVFKNQRGIIGSIC